MPSLGRGVAAVAALICVAAQVARAVYLTPGSYAPCSYTEPAKMLDCSGRGLTEVPSVDPAVTVNAFYLDGNAIVSIGSRAFANLTRSLALLSVKSTVLMERIENLAFADLTSLTTLIIQGKEGSEVSMNKVNIGQLLTGLRSLSSVSMVNVNVNELPISFAGGTSLTDLTLIRTAIATISPYAFSNASNLRTLDVSKNAFGATAGGSMNWLSSAISLETGVFTSCGITKEYLGQIPSLPKMTKLDFTNNGLTRLESNSLSNVATSLAELVLSNNPISEANTAGLAGMLALKKLTMTSNDQLRAIPPEVKQLQALELLDLRGTQVGGVGADSFHPRSQLRSLKLDSTDVRSLHALAFSTVSASLEEFTLSASKLDAAIIQNTAGVQQPGNWTVILDQLRRLQNLSLGGTDLGVDSSGGLTNSIWSAVQLLPNLRRLSLNYNKITAVPDFYLSGFANLSYVSLMGNAISRVTSGTLYGTGGAQILLQSNNLTELDNCTLAMFKSMSGVSLGRNPFSCNCAMQWLWKRVKADMPVNLLTMSCSQPAALAGKTWDTLGESSFCSSGETPPNNCSVLTPSTAPPPTTPSFPYLLNITVSKAGDSSVTLEASTGRLVKQFTSYTVKYWPVSRPDAVLNASRLPMTSGIITLQVAANEKYRFCYALINGSAPPIESQANCRDYTLNGLAGAAVIAIGVLAAILGIVLVFATVCLLCKRLRRGQAKHQTVEEDPYLYTYPDDKQVGKSNSRNNNPNSQFQATLRPESKRYSKRSRNNLAGSRPSLATSTTTLATCRTSSPSGFALQNGARPVSGGAMTQHQHQQPSLLSGAGVVQPSQSMHSIADTGAGRFGGQDPRYRQNQLMSRSQDQLSEAPAAAPTGRMGGRMLPPPPRHAHSQELVLDVTRVPGTGATAANGSTRHLQQQQQQQPSLPPPRSRIPSQSYRPHQQLDQQRGRGADGAAYNDGGYVPMSSTYPEDAAAPAESSTDDFRQPQQEQLAPSAQTYNPYLSDDQVPELTQPPQVRVTSGSGNGGVDNSAFQRNDTSGYYEMGQF